MIELEFRNVDFYRGRKTGEPEEKYSIQGREKERKKQLFDVGILVDGLFGKGDFTKQICGCPYFFICDYEFEYGLINPGKSLSYSVFFQRCRVSS
jgi:hypothetical protein